MADDPVQDLMIARDALIKERRSRARLLARPNARYNESMQSFVVIQQTLEAIDRAIRDERKKKPTARRPGF